MAFDAALSAAYPLTGKPPEQPLTLEAVGGRRGRPHDEVVRRRARDGVDKGLQRLLVDVGFLQRKGEKRERSQH